MDEEARQAWNRELLNASAKPASLYKPEPTYSILIEDFMLALGTFLLTLWRALIGKQDSHVPLIQLPPQSITSDVPVSSSEQKPEFRFNDKVWITEGIYQGMYGNIHSQVGEEYMVSFPEIEERSEPQADHSEMRFAPADWSNETAHIQVVFLKIDEFPEQAQEQAQALYDAFASRYGQYITHARSGLLKELYADISRVGYHIRAHLKAPEPIVAQIKQEYDEAKPYQPWEGVRWEQ